MTLPPRPPSPPSGPPIGVRHSLRNEVQPEPPVPPSTLITTRSMNKGRGKGEAGRGERRAGDSSSFGGDLLQQLTVAGQIVARGEVGEGIEDGRHFRAGGA